MQVGEPKLRLPASEKAWPLSFFNLVHRTTSHGGDGVSVSSRSSSPELRDADRLWPERKAGEEDRGLFMKLAEEMRDWKRLSNGRKEGVGLLRPGREATDGSTLLLGEDITEP